MNKNTKSDRKQNIKILYNTINKVINVINVFFDAIKV